MGRCAMGCSSCGGGSAGVACIQHIDPQGETDGGRSSERGSNTHTARLPPALGRWRPAGGARGQRGSPLSRACAAERARSEPQEPEHVPETGGAQTTSAPFSRPRTTALRDFGSVDRERCRLAPHGSPRSHKAGPHDHHAHPTPGEHVAEAHREAVEAGFCRPVDEIGGRTRYPTTEESTTSRPCPWARSTRANTVIAGAGPVKFVVVSEATLRASSVVRSAMSSSPAATNTRSMSPRRWTAGVGEGFETAPCGSPTPRRHRPRIGCRR